MKGYLEDLYILAFDHRGTITKGLLGVEGREPTEEEVKKVSELKQIIFDGFLKANESGITGGGPLRSQLLMRDRPNPFYVRKFDKEVFYKERELSIQAQNKFKQENRDTWAATYDDPYKGWRQYLDESHSEHPKSVNKSPQNNALKINASDRDNVTAVPTETANNTTSYSGSKRIGDTVYGGGGWFGSGTDIRTSTGGSTALTIHKGDDYYIGGKHLKAGDRLGVLTRKQRARYDKDNPHYMN